MSFLWIQFIAIKRWWSRTHRK